MVRAHACELQAMDEEGSWCSSSSFFDDDDDDGADATDAERDDGFDANDDDDGDDDRGVEEVVCSPGAVDGTVLLAGSSSRFRPCSLISYGNTTKKRKQTRKREREREEISVGMAIPSLH